MGSLPAAFRAASRFRDARAFHPRGRVWRVIWRPEDDGPLAGSPLQATPRPAFLRISHALGLPPGVPDIIGWAIKVLDAHGPGRDQDLLLASSGTGRITRHLLRPAQDVGHVPLSTVLPYDVGRTGVHPIVARARATAPVPYASLVGARPLQLPTFEVRLTDLGGPLLATVTPGEPAEPRLGDALRFDPWNTGPELEPVGWPNRIRRPTYAASQDGRGAPSDGWRAMGREPRSGP